ncbi:MAG: pitrilysin family protein [Gemmatimonadota bacterium]|nr:pitrilysin family protein [Gemmatimonadota bacterium]
MLESVLDNGVRVVTERVRGVRSTAIGVWVRQGSAHEPPELGGVSHLLEHLVFKGTERRSAHEIALSLESLGGSLDAYTTREYTSYQALILDDHLEIALDVLADLVLHPRLETDDLELERDVVLEEIAGVEDTPDDLVFELHGLRFWKGHVYGRPILGTRDTVSSLGIDDLRRIHEECYRGCNILVGCAGDIEHHHVVDLVEGFFGEAPAGILSPEVEDPDGNMVGLDSVQRTTSQTHLVLAGATPAYADPIRVVLGLISVAFGGGMSSRLFQRVREELALAYVIFSFQTFYSRAGSAGVYVATRPETADRTLETIFSEYRHLYESGLSQRELDQAKSQASGQLVLSMESTGARLLRTMGFALRDEPYRSLDDSLGRIEVVTMDQVKKVCTTYFNPDDQYVLSLGP